LVGSLSDNMAKDYKLSPNELELIKQALRRSDKERFEMTTRLYKVQRTMKRASITHKPFIDK